MRGSIRYFFLVMGLLVFSGSGAAQSSANIQLQKVKVNLRDQAVLLRGAKFYAQNCMVCHTMRYLANNTLAEKAGITLDKMPLKQKEWWLNIVPPDLSLMAHERSANWLFTYLISFYKDPSRPTGYNNLVVKDVNMPNILAPFQGIQILTPEGQQWVQGENFQKMPYFRLLELVQSGSMSTEQLDQTLSDLVSFLVYASDPHRLERVYIGIGVTIFLVVFFVLAFLLKRIYWKDLKQ